MTIYHDGRLYLYGAVGDFPGESGFDANAVRSALREHGDGTLTVHINSGGGYATEGAAIHAILQAHPGAVDVVIDGIAASAASLIAMAGKTISMMMGSVLMIHDPAGNTSGTSADHAKTVAGLEALATAYSKIYAAKSGKSPEACRALMRAETWYTPDEAVAAGFADRVDTMQATAMAPFQYTKVYMRTPKRVLTSASLAVMHRAAAETSARMHGRPVPKAKSDHPLAAVMAEANRGRPSRARTAR